MVNLSQLCPPEYSAIHQHRSGRQGGSDAVVYKDSTSLAWRPLQETTGFGAVCVPNAGIERQILNSLPT